MGTDSKRVWVFFYGTFMNTAVLAEYGVIADESFPAKVSGFELTIRPRVNLVASDRFSVYGGLVKVTHDDLARIYSGLTSAFGITYHPEAVLAETTHAAHIPALCYIAQEMEDAPPDASYVRQLAACARKLRLPEWYALHIESTTETRRRGES